MGLYTGEGKEAIRGAAEETAHCGERWGSVIPKVRAETSRPAGASDSPSTTTSDYREIGIPPTASENSNANAGSKAQAEASSTSNHTGGASTVSD